MRICFFIFKICLSSHFAKSLFVCTYIHTCIIKTKWFSHSFGMYNKCLWQFQKCRCQRPCDTVLLFHLEVQICYFWMTVLKGKCCFPLTKPLKQLFLNSSLESVSWLSDISSDPAVERSRVRCWPKFWGFLSYCSTTLYSLLFSISFLFLSSCFLFSSHLSFFQDEASSLFSSSGRLNCLPRSPRLLRGNFILSH